MRAVSEAAEHPDGPQRREGLTRPEDLQVQVRGDSVGVVEDEDQAPEEEQEPGPVIKDNEYC